METNEMKEFPLPYMNAIALSFPHTKREFDKVYGISFQLVVSFVIWHIV